MSQQHDPRLGLSAEQKRLREHVDAQGQAEGATPSLAERAFTAIRRYVFECDEAEVRAALAEVLKGKAP